jgi:hypothetical protein
MEYLWNTYGIPMEQQAITTRPTRHQRAINTLAASQIRARRNCAFAWSPATRGTLIPLNPERRHLAGLGHPQSVSRQDAGAPAANVRITPTNQRHGRESSPRWP